ncbi:MAG: carbamoyltransferase HypF, partial [Rhodospirillales bacterium]|nr:carbamoyltransferase HypF [Rhodospirillales bacterium]
SKPIDQLDKMLSKGLNSPPASSMGRLFDAVAALLGLHADRTSYEGQAAIALESQAKTHGETVSPYPVAAQKIITWEALWVGILDDLKAGKSRPQIAARFHQTLVTVLTETAKQLARQSDFTTIVLSGGVFQNAMLRENLRAGLEDAGYCVLVPQNFPVNDGGIALGQAVIAAAQHRRKK